MRSAASPRLERYRSRRRGLSLVGHRTDSERLSWS
jgi:hypothetical protein